jgi:hypothetical protein
MASQSIPEIEIHAFQDGRKRITVNGIDLSMVVSNVEIFYPVGSRLPSLKLSVPIAKLVLSEECDV